MKKVRYIYRKYLTRYDLDVELFNKWDINVTDLYPFRKIYIIKDKNKKYILKKINYCKEKMDFLADSLEYIKKSFKNVIFIKPCKDGRLTAEYKNKYYILMELIEGRECSLENPLDIKVSSEALADFHKAGRGIQNEISQYHQYDKNIDILCEKKDEMISIKNIISNYRYKDDFDKYTEKNIDNLIDQIESCINRLKGLDKEMMDNGEETIAFCHNDLAYHNILIKGDVPYFVDFEYSDINYKVRDVYQFIMKSIKGMEYDTDICKNIISSYENHFKLLDVEKEYIVSMMSYPNDIIELITNYYYKRKDWSSEIFYELLKSKVIQEENRKEFLRTKQNIFK